MDNEVKEALADMRQAILEIDQKVSAHLQEAEAHSTDSGGESPPEAEAHSTSSEPESADLAEVEELREQVAILQSETHTRRVIQDWLRGLSPEGYVELGKRLGYDDLLLAEVPELEDPDAVHEVSLGDVPGEPKVLFSQTLPEGEDGWMKSESLGCFVKVEEPAA